MKIFKILLIFIGFLALKVEAQGTTQKTSGTEKKQGYFSTYSQQVDQSISFVRLRDGKVLFSRDEQKILSPASVMKLFTAGALLFKFKPSHTFKTKFFYTGEREGSKIKGDLYIVGDGDPFFVSEVLWQVAADIENLGIKEFLGNIVIDNSLFDSEDRDRSREEGETSSEHAYDSPITAFAVNFNTLALTIGPGQKIGGKASVGLDPYPLKGIEVQNSVRTVAEKDRKNASVNVFRKTLSEEKEVLSATGEIPMGSPLKKIYRSTSNAKLISGEYVRAFLQDRGITIKGLIKEGVLPKNAKMFLEVPSYDLRRIIYGLNVYSNNFIADMLVKRLGAAFQKGSQGAGSGNLKNGLAVITDFMKSDVGIKTNFNLKNGSGLDTANRLSAEQLTMLLSYMESRMDLFPEFLGSLPAMGWDGTLKDRFSERGEEVFHGQIRAKTGTLTEPVIVASLAGYFRHKKHGLIAFAIIENGRKGKAQPSIYELKMRQDRDLIKLIKEI